MINPDIYSYIKTEENRYDTQQIRVGDNWMWNMREHVQMIFHLVNGVFYTGSNDFLRSFKNIMEPILNLSFWSEDIEVKDIVFFIKNKRKRMLSFFIKKYHDEVYVKKHNIDEMIDEITESDLEYGGVLVHKSAGSRPEVLPFTSLAFCDQTDILGGPLAFKHNFSPDKLREMKKRGWGDEGNGANISIEELIALAENEKDPTGSQYNKKNETTGKNIEIYIVFGSLPEHYLEDNDNVEEYFNQVHIVGFYTDQEGEKKGVTLFRKKQDDLKLKFFTSKEIDRRALGRGVGEALLHPQVWTNFLQIHKTNMMEAASKVLLYTDDENFTQRNTTSDMDNLETATVTDGKTINQIPNAAPVNVQLFENEINGWFENAQLLGSAQDPLLGKQAPAGTTFRGQERTITQGRGIHDRRRGKRAKFIEEIYRDWIIPEIVKEIVNGKEFVAKLTSEEMEWVTEQMSENFAIRKRINAVLDGKIPERKEILKAEFREKFLQSGSEKFFKILKDEFRDVEIEMGINIANKQKDLAALSDKLLSIFQFVFSNPQAFQQAMQNPSLSKTFNDILEFSGINQADFNTFVQNIPQEQPQQGQPTGELELNQETV